jgi:DNA-binding response OmpR family regulator
MNRPHSEIDKEAQEIYTEMQQNNETVRKLATRNSELAVRWKVLHEQLKLPFFDTNKRTVQWQSGSLILSPQRFQILYTLYFADNQHLAIDDLETLIWGKDTEHSTIKSAVSKLGTHLNDSVFPFYIEGVKGEGGSL